MPNRGGKRKARIDCCKSSDGNARADALTSGTLHDRCDFWQKFTTVASVLMFGLICPQAGQGDARGFVMCRVHQSQSSTIAAWRRGFCLGGLAIIMGAATYPVAAQTSSPEIAAKERSDPASGDVVVINRKKGKGSAPNPYAPIKLKPLPEKWPNAQKPAIEKPLKKAAPKPELRQSATAALRTERPPTPPLPALNTERRIVSPRLSQFPQTGLLRAPEQIDEAPPPRRVTRRPVRERTVRRYRDRRRFSRRNRPRHQCRRLARRCSSGFEGSCYVWQRRCT